MIYIKVLFFWCLINFPITFIGWKLEANMFHISLFFFAGVFLILIFGFIEVIKKDRILNKR